jgi:hypothetical protein
MNELYIFHVSTESPKYPKRSNIITHKVGARTLQEAWSSVGNWLIHQSHNINYIKLIDVVGL